MAIWQHYKGNFQHIFTAHAQKRLFLNLRSKILLCHSLRRPRFPVRQMHFHYRVTFTGYIWCFCASTSHDLVTLTFDLLTLRVCHVQCFSCPTTYQFLLSYDYRLLSYEYWISDHISVILNSHSACAVSRDLQAGAKIVHIFEIPDPSLPVHFVTFTALRRRLSHVIGKISVFPLWRLQSLLRMRSITWPVHRRSPKTTRNNFLTPNYQFTIQLLCGYHVD